MPPIGLLLGGTDFTNLYVNLSGGTYASVTEARAAGAAVIAYGNFLNSLISFVIIAFAVFLFVRQVNRARRSQPVTAVVTTKECPFCASIIPLKAARCPNCTSELRTHAV